MRRRAGCLPTDAAGKYWGAIHSGVSGSGAKRNYAPAVVPALVVQMAAGNGLPQADALAVTAV